MAGEKEAILRKSLEDVARIKRRQTLAFVVLLFAGMIGLNWLGHSSINPAIDVKTMLPRTVFILLFLMVYVALAIALLVTKMTTKVLNAIDLVSMG